MVRIRKALHADALNIIEAHVRSIREVCSQDYTPEQIEAWAGRNFKPELWCQTIDRDIVWVVEHKGMVAGYGHLAIMDNETGEVMGLYLAPEALGFGTGSQLFAEILNEAKSRGVKKLQLHATLTARKFYEKHGFLKVPGKCSVEMRGVDIPCFPMELNL